MNYDKPGCFGSAITYNPKTKTCSGCEDAGLCRLQARQRIEEVRGLVSVEAILKVAHSGPQPLSSRLPEHAQLIVANMNSQQRKAVGVLMRLSDPTAGMFVKSLMKAFEAWTKAEAILIAKEVTGLLVEHQLVSLEAGRIKLRF